MAAPSYYDNSLHTILDGNIAQASDVEDKCNDIAASFEVVAADMDNAVRFTNADFTDQTISGNAATRANKVLGFDGLGSVELKSITDGSAVIASQAEAEAGVDNTNMMTALRTKQAIDYNAIQLASQAEAEAGTEAAKLMTPLRTAQAVDVLAPGIKQVQSQSGSTNVTLTSSSAGYQSIAMTAMGKHVTLPDATTMQVGGPRFVVKNDGGYPFGIRDASGVLVMAVAAGGIAYVTLKDTSTAAGSWSVIGDNLEPGLVTIDNTFSGTYSGTRLRPFVALDADKSIHFLVDFSSGGLYAVAVDNSTTAVGTPVLIRATTTDLRAAFQVSATTAIAFYDDGSANSRAVVISLSGATTLSVGTEASVATYGYWSTEDFSGAPKIARLTSTLYLSSYTSGTNTSVVAVSVYGTTAIIGSAFNIITSNSVSGSTTTYPLTATTGLVLYKSGASSPYTNNAVVISVSGTTCTAGTPASGDTQNTTLPASSVLLSPTKAIILSDNNETNVNVRAITVSGTAVSVGSPLTVESTVIASSVLNFTALDATRYNPHLWRINDTTAGLWYTNSSAPVLSRAVVLSESGGTVTKGSITYRNISVAVTGQDSPGYGMILPQGADEFCVLKIRLASTAGYAPVLSCNKISGTDITVGASAYHAALSPGSPRSQIASRLSSNTYALLGSNAQARGGVEILVFKTNGDFINIKGGIKLPPINLADHPLHAVSSSRLVIIGTAFDGSIISSSISPSRLLNVEIAQ